MKRQVLWLLLILLALVALIPSGISYAQDTSPITDDQVNALAEDLYCPVCENVPLDVCPTQACAQWRELIREKMGLGWSDRQIKEFFAAQYGDQVLAVPPRRGFNWLIYILPPLILITGFAIVAGIIIWSIKLAKSTRSKASSPKPVPQDDIISEIEQDLKRLR